MIRGCWSEYGKIGSCIVAVLLLLFFFNSGRRSPMKLPSDACEDLLSRIPMQEMPKLASLDQSMGYSLYQWLNKEKVLGWCNSALGSDSDCMEPPKCINSPLAPNQSINTFTQPFKVAPSQPKECIEASNGQLPHKNGTQIQVSFIMTITNATSDLECARLILESFVTANEAASVQYSVFRQEPSDKKPPLVSCQDYCAASSLTL